MSRLTGNEVRGLMEAYQAVYAPQELTEEQVWEEVEEWVNALVEEGYDLSDYTWEEMYESYITEAYSLAIPAAAPYILPALGAAAGVAKGLMNRGKAKNTPEEERFLNTGSFAARVTSSDARDKKAAERKAAERKAAERKAAEREAAKNPKPEEKITSVSAPSVQQTPSRGGRIGRNLGRAYGQPSGVSAGASSSGGGGSGGRTPKPEGPNRAQQFLGSKWKEFRQSVGRGGKDSQGRGVTAAGGELAGSLVRTPVRATMDAARKVLSPLIAPTLGAGLLGKGVTDLMDPKTSAGRWIRGVREDYEIGDIIIDYLIEEKYAQDEKSALSIIENMSEKWAVSILENYFES